ncbi:hypothetical protein CYY_006774 [Polysphondylium violaceum]|uniref:Protein farnesyltransferase/geranylgeranyltransferase type-1 subunit alpha n=1 Tax=Polysphondylium violaceum TaxID=133409 RepID=A0A8J4PRE7_9MYCE|nr:hypothetical protein CYY_006774 [Polysphondylium violaceum]
MTDYYTPFGEREEWNDVKPIEQNDGEHPICPIAYSEEFKDKMNYFRAILKSQEKSLRVIDLLNEIVEDNASNYTVWFYRREVLKAFEENKIDFDIEGEMEFLTDMSESDPKNYQVWNHRRFIFEHYFAHKDNGSEKEKEYLNNMLLSDSKNYHAWSHRQWLLKTFKQWSGELEYVDKLLSLDHRNNSAWNHRYFVLSNTLSFPFGKDIIDREIEYSLRSIKLSPNNESPWSYLRGLFKNQKISDYPELLVTLKELKAKYIGCSHVNSLIIDIYEEQSTKDSLEQALVLCKLLSSTVDQIHQKYWNYKHSSIEKQLLAIK